MACPGGAGETGQPSVFITGRFSAELKLAVRSNRPKASVTYLVTTFLFLSKSLFLMYSLNFGISGIHGQGKQL